MTVRLSHKIALANLLPVLVLLVTTVTMSDQTANQRHQIAVATKAAERAGDTALDLVSTARRLNIDLIQIQQWLTDISATRGLDGLDDGYKKAEEARDDAMKQIARAIELSRAIGDVELERSFRAVEVALGPFYAQGRTMAEAYVAEGAHGGNKLMATFDGATEALSTSLEAVVARVDDIAARSTTRMREELGKADRIALGLQSLALWLMGLGTATAIVVQVTLSRTVVRPLAEGVMALRRLGEGDVEVTLPNERTRRDEIADMATALRILRDRTVENRRLKDEGEAAERRAAEQRRAGLNAMAATVERESAASVDHVASEARTMDSTAEEMTTIASEVSEDATGVAVAAEQALASAQAVAGATRQLTASIREIGASVRHASDISRSAVTSGEATRRTFDELSDAVAAIGSVAGLIRDIAEQTNLLALNATIEAARAGDAGRGFAIVAAEVKGLAAQTTRSTDEIAGRIESIQATTRAAVEAVEGMSGAVLEMDEVANAIAAAIEQQTSATEEIAHNVSQTADANEEVSRRIVQVSRQANATGEIAGRLRAVSTRVTGSVEALRNTLVQVVRTSVTETDQRHAPSG